MGTVVPFAKFAFICVLGTLLSEVWFNDQNLFAAFNIAITNLPRSICTGKIAEIIMKEGINVIKSVGSYLTVGSEKRGKAKGPSEWVLEHPQG